MRWIDDQVQYLPAVIAAAKAATIQHPEKASGWIGLATALYNSNAQETARDTLVEAIKHLPKEPRLYLALAKANARLLQFEQGLEAAEEAVRLSPLDENARVYRLNLLFFLARERAQTDDSDRLLELLKSCETLLSVNPGHTEATFCKARTLAKLGRHAEARAILSLDRHITMQDLPIPESYTDAAAFYETLAGEVRRNPMLEYSDKDAERDLRVTDRLLQPDGSAMALLMRQIKAAVDRYAVALPAGNSAFAASKPRQAQLMSWGVIYGERGRQPPHRHPNGWVSGVFYAAAPCSDGRYQGPLVIGAIDEEGQGPEPPWGTITVDPTPGRLVLFPSFVPHRADPCGIPGARICVAFDVVPIRDSMQIVAQSVA